MTTGLQSRLGWLGLAPVADGEQTSGVRLLDYACGSGLVSKVKDSPTAYPVTGRMLL